MKLKQTLVRDPKTNRTRRKWVTREEFEKRKPPAKRQAIHTSNDELNEVAVAKMLKLSVQTLRNRRSNGEPPEYFKRGNRVFYTLAAVIEFQDRRTKKGNRLPVKI